MAAVTAFGGKPGVSYRLALRVVAMGDLNAVDIAQQTHTDLLSNAGCMLDKNVLVYGRALPDSSLFEGLYIDDHFVIAIVPQHQLLDPEGPDRNLIQRSQRAYKIHNLPRAGEELRPRKRSPAPRRHQLCCHRDRGPQRAWHGRRASFKARAALRAYSAGPGSQIHAEVAHTTQHGIVCAPLHASQRPTMHTAPRL